ncbi:endoglucanase [Methanobrevibacter smithii]|uniref:Endoglucanase n=1 Tax=Methanobrevibacter smithii TaxID=2173 RepID=A0A2H4U825_METSM|nr:endoglucanase [Methanobrevibacter smithii]ATZ60259.1 endoglucanase [Methanobrevibacter smithii]
MPNDKEKLLRVMRSLDADYAHGKISEEKYRYFRSKYEDKLNTLDARDATNRIRSMQGKPSGKRKTNPKPPKLNKKKKEEQDLVQKYIINPKKGDKDFNKEKKPPMDNGTFKLIAVLVLVIGFTAGIGYGVLTFDFGNISVTDAQAIVEDTAFPEVEEVKVNDTDNDSVQVGDTYTSDNSYDSGDSSSGQGSGSYDSGTGGEESGSGGSSGSGDSGTVEGTVTG